MGYFFDFMAPGNQYAVRRLAKPSRATKDNFFRPE